MKWKASISNSVTVVKQHSSNEEGNGSGHRKRYNADEFTQCHFLRSNIVYQENVETIIVKLKSVTKHRLIQVFGPSTKY